MNERKYKLKKTSISKLVVCGQKSIKIEYRETVELPCLSMKSYVFTKNATNKKKRRVNQNLQNAATLVLKELESL